MFSVKMITLFIVLASAYVACEAAAVNKSSLAPYLNKKYKLASSDEHFDEIMKALGVGLIKRKLGNIAKPIMELTENGGVYTLSSESTFKDVILKFKLGEEFDEETPDGRMVRSVITQDQNKLIHVQKGEKTTITTREFNPDEVKVVVKVGDIVSVRIYKPL